MFLIIINDKINYGEKMRETYALINLNYLKHNIKEIMAYYPYEYYFGVVKSNAYGHGFEVVKTMDKAGINYFCVATLEEALKVREYTNKPILCFGYVNTNDIDLVIKNDITLSIISYDYYKELKKINKKIKVHIKINSGMNRFGIKDKNELKEIIENLKKSNIYVEGIYTHLATSGVNDPYYDRQINNFKEITSLINLKDIKIVHIYNSLGLARHKKLEFCNGARLGLMMYGFTYKIGESKLTKLKRKLFNKNISPTLLTNNLNLKKVLSLHSEIVNINKLKKDEFVGYNAKFIAKNNTLIAVVSIGHADGVTNSYKNVLINNKKYKIVAICMDYIMVEVDENVHLHDKVDLICEDLPISKINDIPHHIFVSITERVERRYKE